MGLVGEYCTGRLFFAIRVIVSTEEPNEMKNMDENVIECDYDRQLQLKFVRKIKQCQLFYGAKMNLN